MLKHTVLSLPLLLLVALVALLLALLVFVLCSRLTTVRAQAASQTQTNEGACTTLQYTDMQTKAYTQPYNTQLSYHNRVHSIHTA